MTAGLRGRPGLVLRVLVLGVCALFGLLWSRLWSSPRPSAGAGLSSFTFAIPPGWVDLSPGAPQANFDRLPPALVAQARERPPLGTTIAFAADLDHANDGFVENLNAAVVDGTTPPITQEFVSRYASGLSSHARSQGAKIDIVEAGVVTLGNVHVGRMIADVDIGNVHSRTLQYILPGAGQYAALTYSADRATFPSYLPVFEATAAKTTGLREPKQWAFNWTELALNAAVGGVGGGLILAMMRWRKRKQAAAAAASGPKQWWERGV